MDNIEFFAKKYNLNLLPNRDFSILENHRLPAKLNVEFFVFGTTLYCKGKLTKMPNHEYLHIAQFNKYGIAISTFHYIYHITINMFKLKNFKKAFENVPFEVEARCYEKIIEDIQK